MIRGQLIRQNDSERAGPSITRGIKIRTARKRSSVRQNRIKMDLNFNCDSPIINFNYKKLFCILSKIGEMEV